MAGRFGYPARQGERRDLLADASLPQSDQHVGEHAGEGEGVPGADRVGGQEQPGSGASAGKDPAGRKGHGAGKSRTKQQRLCAKTGPPEANALSVLTFSL